MSELTRTQILLAINCVMAFTMSAGLARAAWKNHFIRHSFRPMVWSMGVLTFAMGCEFLKRVVAISLTGQPARVHFIIGGGVSDAVDVLLLIGMSAAFYTMVIAYPDSHR